MEPDREFSLVEICAGAGGQSLGLHKAGFSHQLAVEIDPTAAETLRANLKIPVAVGDVADDRVWDLREHEGVALFAGGVPCPPFSVAGRQLGTSDERDLFAWAIEQLRVLKPRALLLENVRGLSSKRFAAYRQRVLDRLNAEGYIGEWKLVYSADFGVPQLRPRFVLVALRADDHKYFHWPEPLTVKRVTVGEALLDQMSSRGWRHAAEWSELASDVGPTIVGGSKRHGGADLGPTRAKQGWARVFVDGRGIADSAPPPDAPPASVVMPRLTVDMAARIQGWSAEDGWWFAGRKTAQYRQVGNAFPPPVAEAIGNSILSALNHSAVMRSEHEASMDLQDPVYRALAASDRPLSLDELLRAQNENGRATIERKLAAIGHDFELEAIPGTDGNFRYRLGAFKGFIGQDEHSRHTFLRQHRNRVS